MPFSLPIRYVLRLCVAILRLANVLYRIVIVVQNFPKFSISGFCSPVFGMCYVHFENHPEFLRTPRDIGGVF